MKIQNILSFDKESYFNGAVQADWFYDEQKAKMISAAYVFHGPRYFGVGEKDVDAKQHKLLDTASFAALVSDKNRQRSNDFIMTIAGYGMGKSHLAVTLGCLLSGHDLEAQETVVENIDRVDKNIAQKIKNNISGTKNLVVVLNGMNNFNLDYEVLSCVRKALQQHGIDTSVLQDVTKAYSVAQHFLVQTFDIMQDQYIESARKNGLDSIRVSELKEYLLSSLERDERAFNTIDEVFQMTSGHRIQWENGLSAKEILSFVDSKFICESKVFDRIIIIFDEFGRFLEYAAQHPNEAGDSALQQIFETIQNSNGRILHVAFIQSELSAYLKRIDKTGNIERYVGRYEASEKYYLSSNFETILANLIKGKDKKEFAQYIRRSYFQNKRYYLNMQQALNRWVKASNGKYVWSNEEAYINVVCEGCYPLHPYTTWILGNLSNWMQQRSTISFAAEMFEQIKSYTLYDDAAFLPVVRPSDIIESSIFNEMINSEEKGMVQSENCLLYQSIITKLNGQISDKERNVLNAVLILNISQFECFDQNDALVAVSYCACLSKAEASNYLTSLEKQFGVVTYNAAAKRYVLVAEATGRNDYQRVLLRKKMSTYKKTDLSAVDEVIEKYLKLDAFVETPFALENHISGFEWRFEKRLVDVSDLDEKLSTWVAEFDNAYDADHVRGLLILAYDNIQGDTDRSIIALYNKYHLSEKPIIILVLKDKNSKLIDCLEEYSALKLFTNDEKNKYATFFNPDMKTCMLYLGQVFNALQAEKNIVCDKGVIPNTSRLVDICNERFKKCFSRVINFNFDGFEKKLTPTVRKYVTEVAINLGNQTVIDATSFDMLAPDVKNRIKGLLFDGNIKSWKMISTDHKMHGPGNAVLAELFTQCLNEISSSEKKSIKELFYQYLLPPYGLNQYSLTLMVFAFLCLYKDSVVVEKEGEKVNLSSVSSIVFGSAKLQFQILLKLNVRLLIKTDSDLIHSLCEAVLDNTSVEQCSILQERLFAALEKGDIPEELNPAISAAKLKLKEGEILLQDQAKRLTDVKLGVEQLKGKFNLRQAIVLLDKLDKCEGPIGDNTSYVYSPVFTESCRRLQEEIKELISIHGDTFVPRINCSDITQISQFEGLYKKVSGRLADYGFSQLAEAVLERVEYVKNHIVSEQKYQSVLVEFERYEKTQLSPNARRADYEQAITKAKEWKEFWNNAIDYDKDKREKMIHSLSAKIEEFSELILTKEKNIMNLLDSIPRIFEESKLFSIMRKLEHDLSFGFGNIIINKANYYLEKEEAYISFWDMASKSYDAFIQCCNMFMDEDWYVLPFSNFTDGKIKTIEQQYKEKASLWLQRHPLPSEQDIEHLSQHEIDEIVSAFNTIPAYIDEIERKQIDNFLSFIYARNERGKVLSIEKTFVELSRERQQECLIRLSDLFNSAGHEETIVVEQETNDAEQSKSKLKNTEFTEDEIVLLLYTYLLYRDEWFSAQKVYVIELSELYRALPIHPDAVRQHENFRNPAGIDLQLRSMAKCDPSDYHRQKLVASAAMRRVWSMYANSITELNDRIAEIIKKYQIDVSKYPSLFSAR